MLRRTSLLLYLKQIKISKALLCTTSVTQPSHNFGFKSNRYMYNPVKLKIIEDKIQNKTSVSNEEWNEIKESLKMIRGIDNNNVDSTILQFLTNTHNYQLAKEYVKQLKHNNNALNVGIIGNLMKIYYNCGRDNITDEEIKEIRVYYDKLLAKYKMLDVKTNSCFAFAFLLTEDWKYSLNILEEIKKISIPPRNVYSAIAATAFYHEDVDLGWKLMEEMTEKNIFPDNNAYSSWLEYCLKIYKRDKDALLENLEKMFYFCGDKELFMSMDAVLRYKSVFTDVLGWKSEFVSFNLRGVCQICNSNLQLIHISTDEFKLLQKTFYDKVLIGTNAFTKSTPEEKDNFLSFLNKTAPYDIVLDGLNILYSVPNQKNTDLLLRVVGHFVELNKKVLIFGRNHLLKALSKNQLSYIKDNAYLFLTEDLSYDDIFVLYASLYSDKTQFISRDLMRSHRFLLEDNKVKVIFKKWQKRNQLQLKFVEKNGKVIFNTPTRYLVAPQKNDDVWHIPYVLEDFSMLPDALDVRRTWLCLQPPKSGGVS